MTIDAENRCRCGASFIRSSLSFAILATVVLGCGAPRTKTVPLMRVGGIVTFNGEPLEKAVVVFESVDSSFSCAETDSNGHYDLRFDSKTRGVTMGSKTVRISMNRRINGLNSNDEGGPEDAAGGSFQKQPPERIPEKYNVRSTLTAEVTADGDNFNFDLIAPEP